MSSIHDSTRRPLFPRGPGAGLRFFLLALIAGGLLFADLRGAPQIEKVRGWITWALTPLVTMVGLDFASLLGGAIITESVFSFFGLGALAVRANTSYDLPVLIGLLLLAGSFVILANIVVDVLYAYIDPRVRLS